MLGIVLPIGDSVIFGTEKCLPPGAHIGWMAGKMASYPHWKCVPLPAPWCLMPHHSAYLPDFWQTGPPVVWRLERAYFFVVILLCLFPPFNVNVIKT